MLKKFFALLLFSILVFPAFVFAASPKNPAPAPSLSSASDQIAKQTSQMGYYILLTLLIAMAIFGGLVFFFKKIKKK